MKTKMILAATKNLFAEGVFSCLSVEPTLEIADWVTDEECLQAVFERHNPHCIVLGLTFFGTEVAKGIMNFKRDNPNAKILLLSYKIDAEFVKEILEAGANGMISPTFSTFSDVIKAIHRIKNGQTYYCQETSEQMLTKLMQLKSKMASDVVLTVREKQVAKLIAEGLSAKQVAKSLALSPATVEVHRRNILRKIGAHKSAEITKYAIKSEMISV